MRGNPSQSLPWLHESIGRITRGGEAPADVRGTEGSDQDVAQRIARFIREAGLIHFLTGTIGSMHSQLFWKIPFACLADMAFQPIRTFPALLWITLSLHLRTMSPMHQRTFPGSLALRAPCWLCPSLLTQEKASPMDWLRGLLRPSSTTQGHWCSLSKPTFMPIFLPAMITY